jgi:sulfide:quinone oxidoreductase
MADDDHRGETQRVRIAGGGVSGIEAALALRDLAGERVEVHVHDARTEFAFRPFGLGEPYGGARAFRYDMRRLCERCGATFHAGAVAAIDSQRQLAVARDGERLSYDYLIAAPGVRMLWGIPGAITYWGIADEGQVGDVIGELREGGLRHLVFTMPEGRSWTLPLYALALLAVTERDRGANGRTRITVVTPEKSPLEIFGRRVSEQTSALLVEMGIEVVAGGHPVEFESGRLRLASGGDIAADVVIALPRLEGRRIDGIPHDDDGYVRVDEYGGVIGLDRVFAVGDVSAFPLKQGGVAAHQADVAAEAIAAAAGAEVEPQPFEPILRSVLWAGSEARHLDGGSSPEHREASRFGKRRQTPLRNDKIVARYLTPFVESLSTETGASGARQTAASL